MKKNKRKIAAIISAAVAFSVLIGVIVVVVLYNTTLKPADFTKMQAPASGDGTGYYRHCYEELNENERLVYTAALAGLYSHLDEIEIPELKDGNLTNIFRAISYDNPDLFNIGLNCSIYEKGYKTYFKADYRIDKNTYLSQYQEMNDIAIAIANGTAQFTSIYEKEKYIHDYIINHCEYVEPTESPNANTIYGCLVEGKASCEGYSRAFQYILGKISLDNRLVTGESANDGVNYIGHMWNYVLLEGEGYFVDLTWDDPKAEGSVLRHTYFNVTTRDIQIKHRNVEQVLPPCTSTKYNFFYYESAYFETGSGADFENKVLNIVLTAVQRKSSCVEMRFSSTALMAQGKNSLFNSGVIYRALSDAGLVSNTNEAKVYYSTDDKTNVICIYI